MRREFEVAGSWEPSRAELSQEPWPGRARSRAEPSRARSLGRGKSGAEPSQEPSLEPRGRRPGPGGFVLGIGLEMPGVVVAIGCIVYECLEHEVDIYAAVMFSYRV